MPQPVHRPHRGDVMLDISVPAHLYHEMMTLEETGASRLSISMLCGVPLDWVHISLGPYPNSASKR